MGYEDLYDTVDVTMYRHTIYQLYWHGILLPCYGVGCDLCLLLHPANAVSTSRLGAQVLRTLALRLWQATLLWALPAAASVPHLPWTVHLVTRVHSRSRLL